MIEILKASAGSGKTFNLARTYLEIIIRMKKSGGCSSFRNILAVTFTNKATAEMKNRILRELHLLSREPEKSHFLKFFVPEPYPDAETLRRDAEDILLDILHDYSAFAVSTIDKFFQQTLRSFAREMGHFSPYQIELDRKSVIHEAVDRMLESLSDDDRDLLGWMSDNLAAQVEAGGRISIENTLYEISERLKSTDFIREDISREQLSDIRDECDRIVADFENRFFEEFPEKRSASKPGSRITLTNKAAREKFGPVYGRYYTAWLIRGHIWGLGTAREFFDQFDSLVREKNLMCLEESNTILRDIIDDCKAPFVYEKTGVRFESFLLDEFQDTSVIQWENFAPLLEESESAGHKSLVVGDVKQSIYRWRGSEWKLLSRDLPERFPRSNVRTLTWNWRSAPEIVAFNNNYFTWAAAQLGLSEIYSDVVQEPHFRTDERGSVAVSFCDDRPSIGAEILSSVKTVIAAGARLSDIAILVRTNDIGSDVASYLIGSGIPVITDDSLQLRRSRIVRRLTSLLSSMENPDDRISAYLAQSLSIELPRSYHSLPDLCETILSRLMEDDPDLAAGEILFIQSFMDTLQDWVGVNGNNLRAFLSWWKDCKESISSPAGTDAVRIMTIHKAKGLEFNYVILPYASSIPLYKKSSVWCRPSAAAPEKLQHYFPITLEKAGTDSYFSDALAIEVQRQMVDNMNILYVAMTRAVYGLHIIASTPSGACRAACQKDKPYDYINMGEMLYAYTRTRGTIYGRLPDLGAIPRREKKVAVMAAQYRSWSVPPALRVGGRKLEEGARRDGIILHGILSAVEVPSDLHDAVLSAVRRGEVPAAEAAACEERLAAAIASKPEWFPSESGKVKVLNEVALIGSDGEEKRPDRVILDASGRVTVIDYKFGRQEKEHLSQVGRYVQLYRELGYGDVCGYLWYLSENNVIFVS